jgi:ADP-ribosylglycohydrolase
MFIPPQLRALFPKNWDEMTEKERRFTAALIAYSAGDAFGAYYEFSEISKEVSNQLKTRKEWPSGAVSDDTCLTILTLLSLEQDSPINAADKFLKLLREKKQSLRGLGPTTRAALGLPVKDFEKSSIGLTNGALMRTSILGFLFEDAIERDNWVRALANSTHKDYAVELAVSLATKFAHGEKPSGDNGWQLSSNGVSNDARDTYAAVENIIDRTETVIDAMILGCMFGGDTDTTVAVSSSFIAFNSVNYGGLFEIPWLNEVDWLGIYGFEEALSIAFEKMK